MEKLAVLRQGRKVGAAELTEEGLYLRFTVDCAVEGSAPCRLFAVGQRGELRLGVPEPEAGRWRLSRAISRRDCAAAGPFTHLELRLPPGEQEEQLTWEPLRREGEFHTALLRQRLAGETHALLCRRGELRLLALPFDIREPFPWPELFCFARILPWQGRDWAVFAFDPREMPVIPGSWSKK